MPLFTLPLVITTRTSIEIEAANVDEAHDKLIEMGKEEVLKQGMDCLALENEFNIDWDSYEPPTDMPLAERCRALYEVKGQYAIYDFIKAEHPEVKWGFCSFCEDDTPRDPKDDACLVCGSSEDGFYKKEETVKTIKVVLFEVGKAPKIVDMEDSLAGMRSILNSANPKCYIVPAYARYDLKLYYEEFDTNEQKHAVPSQKRFSWQGYPIHGSFFAACEDESGEFRSLTNEEINCLLEEAVTYTLKEVANGGV